MFQVVENFKIGTIGIFLSFFFFFFFYMGGNWKTKLLNREIPRKSPTTAKKLG